MKNNFILLVVIITVLFCFEGYPSSVWFTSPTNGAVLPCTGGNAFPTYSLNVRWNQEVTGSNTVSWYLKLFADPIGTYTNDIPQWFYLPVGTYTWRIELWECTALECFKTAEQTITFYITHDLTVSNNFLAGNIKIDGAIVASGSHTYKISGQNLVVGAIDQDYASYHRLWNQSGINNSVWKKKIKNGAYMPINGGTPRDFTYNVISNDNGADIQAQLRKSFNLGRDDLTEFDGTQHNPGLWNVVEENSCSISAPATQNMNGKSYKYSYWADNYNAPNPRSVSPNDNITYTAFYKFEQHSDNQAAYTKNSQRKFIRTDNGILHNVYESKERVWYEVSTDNGVTWHLSNNAKPLDNGKGKSPSITMGYSNSIAIVFQQWSTGGHYTIELKGFYNTGNSYVRNLNETLAAENSDSYSTNADPVAFWGESGDMTKIITIWKNESYLKYCSGIIGINSYSSSYDIVDDNGVISGTDASAQCPTIGYNAGNFYSAWQQHDLTSNSNVYLKTITFYWDSDDPPGQWRTSQGSRQNISAGAGFSYNTQPSIIGYGSSARLVWLGKHYGIMPPVVIYNNLSDRYWNFGTGAATPSINETADGNFAIGWAEGTTAKFTTNSLSYIKSIAGISSQNIQMSNGSNFSSMYAQGFNNSSLPFYFQTSSNLNSYMQDSELGKVTSSNIFSGREGVVYNDSIHFYFMLGDIIIDGEPVDFIQVADSISINSKEQINQYLVSNPFSINSDASFTYGVEYGVSDSSLAAEFLGETGYVNFKVLLIDNATGETLGEFDNVTFTRDNLCEYENIAYQVNTSGIGSKTVYLKLQVENNFESSYSLTDAIRDDATLAKNGYKNINFNDGIDKITSYDLSQNFPNPFNPTTTINYQLPQNGFVILKIYDILGKEVATLVNEEKPTGRYSVNFDGSNFSSGVYIYQIHINDYVSSRKLLLLK